MNAPIVITVYDRLEHLERCIYHLQKCPESSVTRLYIASDWAYQESDIQKVNKVRDYILTIKGFSQVIPIFRSYNYGSLRNSLDAQLEVFRDYDRLIRLEDDVLVGEGFLSYMNAALEVYKDEPSVVSISAYLPPDLISDDGMPFLLHMRTPYGLGKWREKEFELLKYAEPETLKSCFQRIEFFREYERRFPHSARVLPMILEGDIRPLDVISEIIMLKKSWFALFPPESISKTIGNDMSGENATINKKLLEQSFSDNTYNIFKKSDLVESSSMARKLGHYYGFRGSVFLNYFIFLMYRYFPLSYWPYKLSRKYFRKLRKKLFLTNQLT